MLLESESESRKENIACGIIFSFGIIMLTMGILGNYIWRIFDASRKRPPYIVEDEFKERK